MTLRRRTIFGLTFLGLALAMTAGGPPAATAADEPATPVDTAAKPGSATRPAAVAAADSAPAATGPTTAPTITTTAPAVTALAATRAAAVAVAAAADRFADPPWVKQVATTRPASRPAALAVPGVDHVVLISLDGCRPDVLLRNDAPAIGALFRGGAYTFWAKTTPNGITLPSHASMLTGVTARSHEIEWNKDLPLLKPVYPAVPTLFFLAKRYGYTTGFAAGKSKFDALAVPGTIDHESITDKKTTQDTDVAAAAAEIVANYQPNLMFVHLPGLDNAGHAFGWGSREQGAAVATADAAVGRILAAVHDAGLADRTVVIVTADHGGAGKTHGPDDPRSRHIPWIASGPGVRRGVDLTTDADLDVRTEDTFATACWLLGIPVTDKRVVGRPVEAAFREPQAGPELLKRAPAAQTVTAEPSW
jgi:hypothetical protein